MSFRYPATWTLTSVQHFYIPESVLTLPAPQSGGSATARAAVYREGKGWPGLEKTNLNGADFVYNTTPGVDAKACTAWLRRQVDFDKTDEQTVNGLTFTHVRAGSAGLCHGADESIYIHQAHGTCYFFDLAVHTLCPGVVEGTRGATPAELDGVRSQLEKVFASVHISQP